MDSLIHIGEVLENIGEDNGKRNKTLGGNFGGDPFLFPFGFVVKFALIVPKNDVALFHSAPEITSTSFNCCFS